jgi:hypothetical protein
VLIVRAIAFAGILAVAATWPAAAQSSNGFARCRSIMDGQRRATVLKSEYNDFDNQ